MTGPVKKSAISGPVLWVILGLLAVGGGGAFYLLNQPAPEVITPPTPTPTPGPVEPGRPLVVKELPFLTTTNRQVNVTVEGEDTTSVGPSNRTSNPFVQVYIPVTEGSGSTANNPQSGTQTDTQTGNLGGSTTYNPPVQIEPAQPIQVQPVPVDNGSVQIPDPTPLPSPVNGGSTKTNPGASGSAPIPLPSGTTGTTGTQPNKTRPPVLPTPSVVQPGTSSSFSVPDQESTVIAAPTPVLISSLVLQQPKANVPDTTTTTPQVSELLKVSQELQLAFSSVVIGPNSTAVFNSKNGYLMAAAGQKLAGTDIVVKSISQQQVTLQLGEETLELNLDRR